MEEALPQIPGVLIALIPLLIVWSSVWKAIALWKAARLGSKAWFVILFIVNALGILEIIYIFAIAKKKSPAPIAPAETPAPQI
ncbi:hypothetical protein KKD19_03825 [Patescibacteria group bacterium]|nr:hypothetical protein [Patescibacteria group bacterium]MBU4512339.1 hypothetical protein [Patescibacteria group bacterium]MCG2692541.1 DUF5652 family protein [Candidatus Parcubacteria bacterium]